MFASRITNGDAMVKTLQSCAFQLCDEEVAPDLKSIREFSLRVLGHVNDVLAPVHEGWVEAQNAWMSWVEAEKAEHPSAQKVLNKAFYPQFWEISRRVKTIREDGPEAINRLVFDLCDLKFEVSSFCPDGWEKSAPKVALAIEPVAEPAPAPEPTDCSLFTPPADDAAVVTLPPAPRKKKKKITLAMKIAAAEVNQATTAA
jgi:hypothetical protein